MANTYSLDLEASSNQYGSISDGSQTGLDLSGDFTFESWLKAESEPSGDFYGIISKYNTTGNQRAYQIRYRDDGGTKSFYLSVSSAGTSGSTSSAGVEYDLDTGTWYHAAVTFDASAGEMELFINSVSQGTASGLETSIFNSTATFLLGFNGGNDYWDGKMDEVRIWSDIRTQAEIADNMNVELVGNEAGLVAYWNCNQNLDDATSNGNDLTEVNSPTYSTDVPFTGEGATVSPLFMGGGI